MKNLFSLTLFVCLFFIGVTVNLEAQTLNFSSLETVGKPHRISSIEGERLQLEIPDERATENTYTWFKTSQSGIPERISATPILSFEAIRLSDQGQYYAEIRNEQFPDVVLKSNPYFVKVFPEHMSHESARDHTGKLRFTLHLPPATLTETQKIAIKERLIELGATEVLGESCLCGDEFTLWHMPERMEIGGEIIVGAASLINSACEDIEEEGGVSVSMGYDYLIDDVLPQANTDQLHIQYPGSLERKDLDKVRVAIIDLGVDKSHLSLGPYFQPIESRIACIEGSMGYNFVENNSHPFDVVSSHGTHVAGILTGFIPNLPMELMSLQVGKVGGDTRVFDIACAIRYAMYQEVDVINLSMGYQGPESELLRQVIADLRDSKAQTQLITSTGNKGQNMALVPSWPAAYSVEFPDYVVSVAAMNEDYSKLAEFSNYGISQSTIAAPGVNIRSTVNGRYAFDQMSGTSMAAPFVSSVMAYLKAAYPQDSPAERVHRLLSDPRFSHTQSSLQGLVKDQKVLQVTINQVLPSKVEGQIKAAPNPALNQVVLDIANPENKPFDVQIRNIEGKIIRTEKGLSGNYALIEKENLAPGIYLMTVKIEGGTLSTTKVVFQ